MREDVVFKGSKDGLELVLNQTADFTAILEQLKEKLESAAYFFTGSTGVKVSSGTNTLTGDERRQLISLLAGYGLALHDRPEPLPPEISPQDNSCGEAALYRQENEGGQTLIISRTLRSGQKVVFDGSVIVMGDVNPGSEIIASGNITVQGTCRGLAHAGANGDQAAVITADKLIAGQLRIAGLIARAPDNQDVPAYRETARIDGGVVVIGPADDVKIT
ncbi:MULTISPECIES: septum site-determining protein MinC [Sporomusa]|jgi:septum site-determining protein MinC|uniref:Probable septum site-determining protein MinC n=1 Tax=Sporomusa sphaeroides DSM 2875 TaxID=1337886 RepID=A0ABM9W5U7_9FIRM|nr:MULTISPECIES: septum site-determining protein MinC [Sporomusa]MCM0758287.1 septum site-determining protein MinC [Sporomusa sphaeroides DSM 2875]OLS57913.1 septum site-determining protein MinC [Sporomusa sphaeroides DSM 2875]CVK20426.1 Septum site-determining protein MinC [Sporomusa sphaeroides DSM 2875]